ncbi:hypothetical protein I3760_05G225500 [Carya illinoinensis]|nr:hypothetical protein I3760_05G225500 [Carya illinoinensis]
MERSEPTLFPEWLRNTGSVTGGGISAHHSASTATHSDGPSLAHHTRTRNSKGISDFDAPRSAFLDRASSSNSRRSSTNGSAKHAYSSFNRNHRDKEKERLSFRDHWDHDSSDPLGSIFPSRVEKDKLWRSQSMVSRKQGEPLTRRIAVDFKNGSSSNHNGNGVHSGGSVGSSMQKAVFEKDFPSLGTEERQGAPDIGRVSSPGLSSAVQSLPVGSAALIGGEGWTSALAEVPTIIGSSSRGSLSIQHVNQSPRGGHSKSDASKTSHGKFLVLKPTWENGVSPTLKDVASPTHNSTSKAADSQLPISPSVASSPLRSPHHLKNSSLDRKVAALNLKSGSTLERKPSLSQVQSRNDFFNLIKMKTSTNNSTVLQDSGHVISSTTVEKSDVVIGEVVSAPASPHATRIGAEMTSDGDTCDAAQRFSVGENNMSSSETVYPDEKEAAFLRSLGWEENSGEDEGLTEEEINAFYQECMKLKPSLKLCRGMQPILSKLSESHLTSFGGAPSELSSPHTGSEA